MYIPKRTIGVVSDRAILIDEFVNKCSVFNCWANKYQNKFPEIAADTASSENVMIFLTL